MRKLQKEKVLSKMRKERKSAIVVTMQPQTMTKRRATLVTPTRPPDLVTCAYAREIPPPT